MTDNTDKNDFNLMTTITNLSPQTKEVIGLNGVMRLQKFALLRDGWDDHQSLSMQPDSIDSFDKFFSVEWFNPIGVSVFLAPKGNVVANWQTAKGMVEIEFTTNGAEYMLEGGLIEGIVPNSNFEELRSMTL